MSSRIAIFVILLIVIPTVEAYGGGDVDFRVVAANRSGGNSQRFTVVQSKGKWSDLWKRMQTESGRRDPELVPMVDFERETLLVAAPGNSLPGAEIAIQSVKMKGSTLRVTLIVMQMGPGCVSVDYPNSPLIAAATPKFSGLVEFAVIPALRDCSKQAAEINVSAGNAE